MSRKPGEPGRSIVCTFRGRSSVSLLLGVKTALSRIMRRSPGTALVARLSGRTQAACIWEQCRQVLLARCPAGTVRSYGLDEESGKAGAGHGTDQDLPVVREDPLPDCATVTA
jgi:hypothetical protein